MVISLTRALSTGLLMLVLAAPSMAQGSATGGDYASWLRGRSALWQQELHQLKEVPGCPTTALVGLSTSMADVQAQLAAFEGASAAEKPAIKERLSASVYGVESLLEGLMSEPGTGGTLVGQPSGAIVATTP